jgi:hypothetical protein
MYSVETEVAALHEVSALPAQALPAYAELKTLLEVAPWSGDPYNLQRPDTNMRTHTFGEGADGLAAARLCRTAAPPATGLCRFAARPARERLIA